MSEPAKRTIYLVNHEYSGLDYEATEVVGVFSTRERADAYIARNPESCRHVFTIAEWEIDAEPDRIFRPTFTVLMRMDDGKICDDHVKPREPRDLLPPDVPYYLNPHAASGYPGNPNTMLKVVSIVSDAHALDVATERRMAWLAAPVEMRWKVLGAQGPLWGRKGTPP